MWHATGYENRVGQPPMRLCRECPPPSPEHRCNTKGNAAGGLHGPNTTVMFGRRPWRHHADSNSAFRCGFASRCW